MERSFIARNPSVLIFLSLLALFTLGVTVLSEGFGIGVISTSFVKVLGKTLCLCLVAIAMDLIWGYTGILSLGHFAFFGLGGYMIGMWLMYERTRQIVESSLSEGVLPPTPEEISAGIGNQIFGVVGSSEFPLIWAFADSLVLQLAFVVLVPGILALVFGWLAFRSRVTGVYLSILTQAMTLGAVALSVPERTAACAGNNGLSGLQNLPGVTAPQSVVSLVVLLGLGTGPRIGLSAGGMGGLRQIRVGHSRHPRQRGARAVPGLLGRNLQIGSVHPYGLRLWHCRRALLPAGGHHQPGRRLPPSHRSTLPCGWRLAGAAGFMAPSSVPAFVSLCPAGSQAARRQTINLGFYTVKWVDWWLVLLGLVFVLVTLYAPKRHWRLDRPVKWLAQRNQSMSTLWKSRASPSL